MESVEERGDPQRILTLRYGWTDHGGWSSILKISLSWRFYREKGSLSLMFNLELPFFYCLDYKFIGSYGITVSFDVATVKSSIQKV